MITIISALMSLDNDGNGTDAARATFYAQCRMDGVTVLSLPGCHGIWYDENGKLFSNPTTIVRLKGNEAAIDKALAGFGTAARQHSMLRVVVPGNGYSHLIDSGWDMSDAQALARKHGGATLLPSGRVHVYDYAELAHGTDYSW